MREYVREDVKEFGSSDATASEIFLQLISSASEKLILGKVMPPFV